MFLVLEFSFISVLWFNVKEEKHQYVPQGFVVCLGLMWKKRPHIYYNEITAMCDGEWQAARLVEKMRIKKVTGNFQYWNNNKKKL